MSGRVYIAEVVDPVAPVAAEPVPAAPPPVPGDATTLYAGCLRPAEASAVVNGFAVEQKARGFALGAAVGAAVGVAAVLFARSKGWC